VQSLRHMNLRVCCLSFAGSYNSHLFPCPIHHTYITHFITLITHQYSGGQATEGQGGYYGSGGARAKLDEHLDPSRRQLLALAADVEKITNVMEELEALEESLMLEAQDNQKIHADDNSNNNNTPNSSSKKVTSKTMELKNAIKKLMTAPDVIESLNRLEVQGQPTWGLSTKERELIMAAREKINES
jgi:hypothetical protein